MTHEDLLNQKKRLEALIWANLEETNFIRASDDIDWAILNTYYLSGRAFAAAHTQVVNELERR